MGSGNGNRPDFYGTPEYFVNRIYACEPAGGDNIRVYCCATRGTELIPLYTVVMPLVDLMEANSLVKRRASEIWTENQFSMMQTLN